MKYSGYSCSCNAQQREFILLFSLVYQKRNIHRHALRPRILQIKMKFLHYLEALQTFFGRKKTLSLPSKCFLVLETSVIVLKTLQKFTLNICGDRCSVITHQLLRKLSKACFWALFRIRNEKANRLLSTLPCRYGAKFYFGRTSDVPIATLRVNF